MSNKSISFNLAAMNVDSSTASALSAELMHAAKTIAKTVKFSARRQRTITALCSLSIEIDTILAEVSRVSKLPARRRDGQWIPVTPIA